MAWTELHDTLPDHPKTKLLVAELGSTKAHAVGLLCALWCFTMRFGSDGKISEKYWRAFAADMGEKDPDGTLAALKTTGWVSNGDGVIACHDWDDYAGRLEEYKRRNRERQRKHRERMRDVTESSSDVTAKKRESHTDTTQPNITEQTTTTAQKRGSGSKPKPVDPDSIQLPDDLKSYRAPITEFVRWRLTDKKKPVREGVGWTKFLGAVRECVPNVQAAVDKAIANDWQGLFPANKQAANSNRAFAGSQDDEEIAKYGGR